MKRPDLDSRSSYNKIIFNEHQSWRYNRGWWGRGAGDKDGSGGGAVTLPPGTSPLTRGSHCPPQSLSRVPQGQQSRMTGPILQLEKEFQADSWLAQCHTGLLVLPPAPQWPGSEETGVGGQRRANAPQEEQVRWKQQRRGARGHRGAGCSYVGNRLGARPLALVAQAPTAPHGCSGICQLPLPIPRVPRPSGPAEGGHEAGDHSLTSLH